MPQSCIRRQITVYTHCWATARSRKDRYGRLPCWQAHSKLDNLVVIVDNNNLQIDGTIDEVNSPYPIDKKFEAFNFHVINIDGNDFDQIDAAFKEARDCKGTADCDHCKDRKRQRCFLHGKSGWMAWKSSE